MGQSKGAPAQNQLATQGAQQSGEHRPHGPSKRGCIPPFSPGHHCLPTAVNSHEVQGRRRQVGQLPGGPKRALHGLPAIRVLNMLGAQGQQEGQQGPVRSRQRDGKPLSHPHTHARVSMLPQG